MTESVRQTISQYAARLDELVTDLNDSCAGWEGFGGPYMSAETIADLDSAILDMRSALGYLKKAAQEDEVQP